MIGEVVAYVQGIRPERSLRSTLCDLSTPRSPIQRGGSMQNANLHSRKHQSGCARHRLFGKRKPVKQSLTPKMEYKKPWKIRFFHFEILIRYV